MQHRYAMQTTTHTFSTAHLSKDQGMMMKERKEKVRCDDDVGVTIEEKSMT